MGGGSGSGSGSGSRRGFPYTMVDTGATGDFIDQDFVTRVKLPTRKVSQLIPVYNVDGTLNKARSIRDSV